MKTRSLILITAALLLPLGLAGCSSEETAATATTATQEAPPLPADMQVIADATNAATATSSTSGDTATTADPGAFEATGEFVSPVRSELAPKIGGRVARMHVNEGSRVRRGQPVLELETDYVRLNLQSAEAEVARARAARDEASRDLERKKELIAKNSIPQATFSRSQAAFEQANASLSGAAAQAALLRQQLADSTLRSPVDGIIAEKRTDVGARLGDGGIAFVVVQISPLKLRFQVPSATSAASPRAMA
jgi:RND family efflux transporter MFP subunit